MCDCYEAEYGTLAFDDNGVPLEHLVTCVSGLELVTNNNTGIKYITSAVARASLDDRKSEGKESVMVHFIKNNLENLGPKVSFVEWY